MLSNVTFTILRFRRRPAETHWHPAFWPSSPTWAHSSFLLSLALHVVRFPALLNTHERHDGKLSQLTGRWLPDPALNCGYSVELYGRHRWRDTFIQSGRRDVADASVARPSIFLKEPPWLHAQMVDENQLDLLRCHCCACLKFVSSRKQKVFFFLQDKKLEEKAECF